MSDRHKEHIFEIDRRMQLRLRLAAKRRDPCSAHSPCRAEEARPAKRASENPIDVMPVLPVGTPPEREVVRRLIERVRLL